MKLYTDESQTAKLIELGFEKPKYECLDTTLRGVEKWNNIQSNYSIGELIEMLPKSLKNPYNPPLAIECNEKWRVYYGVPEDYSWDWSIWYEEEKGELIDAIYMMILKLKNEEVI